MQVARDIVENIQSFYVQVFSAKDIERFVMDKLSNPNEEDDILMKRYSSKWEFSHKKLKYWCGKSEISVYFDELNETYTFENADIFSDGIANSKSWELLHICFRNPNQMLNHLQDYKE